MNHQRFEIRVMDDEGFSSEPYLDTEGVATIGYGSTSIMERPVTMHTNPITPYAARVLLRNGLYVALLDAEHVFATFSELDDVRQEVLANMAYNLGRRKLGGFKRLADAVHSGDYARAADEMMDSHWSRQVGERAVRLAHAMRTGEWER